MKSLWSADDAADALRHYGASGVGEELALRVYTTRLLGSVPELVLHGGGNTSVKTTARELTGDEVEVLCVKGSGWDMGDIEPPGLPAVRLAPLRKLISLDALSDEDMVNVQRGNLLDQSSPNPSVETLLHAFLPQRYVDHTHANAVLALCDQPEGDALCREVYGERAAIVPYIMPGFSLARAAAEVQARHPQAEGLILLKHGIFSFGETAREAYERMIALVSLAEERVARVQVALASVPRASGVASVAEVAPILRGLLAQGEEAAAPQRFVLSHRDSDAIRAYVSGAEVERYSQQGTVTPDHAIRIKPKPLLLPEPREGALDRFAQEAADAVALYRASYAHYFERNDARVGGGRVRLDTAPRVLLVPGLGLFAAGKSARDAAIAGDLAETTVEVVSMAESVGRFESLSEADLFDMEYWSLEQAKLGKVKEAPLARQVCVVTGAAGAIGAATAAAFREQGAELALLDRDGPAVLARAAELGAYGLECDVTSPESVKIAFDLICERYGGVDIVVSNAGAAWQGRIGEVDDATLRESFELNFFAHQSVAKNAVRVMRAQRSGGALLFNVSKQAVNPGPDFGPYGLPKAALLALVRQYAVDYGSLGIRANGLNADRIRSGLLTDAMVEQRAEARGLSEQEYMRGNLLGREVTASDVAQAFVSLALAEKTTGAVLTVDGGNAAAALR